METSELVPVSEISDEDLIATLTKVHTRAYSSDHAPIAALWCISGLKDELRYRGYTIKEHRRLEIVKDT